MHLSTPSALPLRAWARHKTRVVIPPLRVARVLSGTCLSNLLATCALQNVEEHQVREVLKCIIHTIIFNRALGHVSPRDMDLQLIDVSYVEVDDEDIERQVNNSLRDVEGFLSTHKVRSGANARRVRTCTRSFFGSLRCFAKSS